jgi:chromosomal replication initiator protein
MPRPPLTFARFLPLPENRSALAAVRRMADCLTSRRPKRSDNPLYLHGPAGSGKTHLASAVVEDVTHRAPELVAAVLSAGDLRTTALPRDPDGEVADGLQAARDSDLLVIEDVQHLDGRASETVVQLLDHLLPRGGQVVVTALVGPRHLDLPGRLTSRLAGGLVVGLEPLQVSSRLALLQDKAQRRQLAVGRDVLAWLAENLAGGRQLEGALTRLEALARVPHQPLDVAAVAAHFREQADAARPTVERIAAKVSSHFHVEPKHLRSGRRSRSVLLPRQIGMYLTRRLTGLSLEQIGHYFGGRDHSTVLHACRKVEQALAGDAALSGTVRQLHAALA